MAETTDISAETVERRAAALDRGHHYVLDVEIPTQGREHRETAKMLRTLRAALTEAELANQEKWSELAKARLQSAAPDGKGGFMIRIQAGIVPLIAEMLSAHMDDAGAENYLGLQFDHPKKGSLMVTIQRVDGLTPEQVCAAVRTERDAARRDLAAAREALDEARQQLEYLDSRWPTGTTPTTLVRIAAALAPPAPDAARESVP